MQVLSPAMSLRLPLRHPRLLLLTGLFLVFAVTELADEDGLRKLIELDRSVAELEAHNAQARGENERLRRRVAALDGDPAALERSAREHGYVREDELLFELD